MGKFRINDYTIENPKIKKNITVATISDIHRDIEKLNKIYELLKRIKVDLICIPGDVIDRKKDKRNEELVEVLNKISNIAKTYICLGNHDRYNKKEDEFDFFEELEKKSKCIILKEEFNSIRYDDNTVINAISLPSKYYFLGENKDMLMDIVNNNDKDIDDKSYNILLVHSTNKMIKHNEIINEGLLGKMNLILSGHNHGCLTPRFIQLKSKNHIGFVAPYYRLICKNGYGTYINKNTSLIINNGVTKISNTSIFTVFSNYLNKIYIPDIDIIKLKKGRKNKLVLNNTKIYKD